MTADDVAARSARGAGATVLGRTARIAIQLVGVVVLSRLLSPADFGLVAMVTVFIALGDLLRDFGMPTAALQARTLSHQQSSNLFWVNAALGGVAALLLVSATPLLMRLYDEPRLGAVVPVMASALAVNGLQAQVQVQLARSMRFVALAVSDAVAQVAGLIAALVVVGLGLGYWALVAQVITAALALLVLRVSALRWLPAAPRGLRESRDVLRSGTEFGLAHVLTYGANNADTLLIGATWSAADLGLYNRAFQLFVLPRNAILDPLTQVVVPMANALVASGRSAGAILLRLQSLLGLLVVWLYATAAGTAGVLIPLALGGQWSESVAVFEALAVAGCFTALSTIAYWAFIIEQRGRDLLYLHLVTKPLVIVLVAVAVPRGIVAVAWAYALALAIGWPLNLIALSRKSDVDVWAHLRAGLRVLAAGVAAHTVAQFVAEAIDGNAVVRLFAAAAAGTAAYLVIASAIPGGTRELARARDAFGLVVSARGRGATKHGGGGGAARASEH